MAKFGLVILAVFLFIGIRALFANVVTATTASVTVASSFWPILLAAVAIFAAWRLFR